MILIRIEFNNNTECELDNVVSYEINERFLEVKFKNKCIRSFDRENIEKLEVLKNG